VLWIRIHENADPDPVCWYSSFWFKSAIRYRYVMIMWICIHTRSRSNAGQDRKSPPVPVPGTVFAVYLTWLLERRIPAPFSRGINGERQCFRVLQLLRFVKTRMVSFALPSVFSSRNILYAALNQQSDQTGCKADCSLHKSRTK
jgi:hypothetical protein